MPIEKLRHDFNRWALIVEALILVLACAIATMFIIQLNIIDRTHEIAEKSDKAAIQADLAARAACINANDVRIDLTQAVDDNLRNEFVQLIAVRDSPNSTFDQRVAALVIFVRALQLSEDLRERLAPDECPEVVLPDTPKLRPPPTRPPTTTTQARASRRTPITTGQRTSPFAPLPFIPTTIQPVIPRTTTTTVCVPLGRSGRCRK